MGCASRGDGVDGFGWVGTRLLLEVRDKVREFCLRECFECLEAGCCDDEGGVVGVGVHLGIGYGVQDVVNVEEEEGGGECAALWDAMCDGLEF